MGCFELELIEEKYVNSELDQKIRTLLCECFPLDTEILSEFRFRNGVVPEYSVIYLQENRVLGHVGVVFRNVICSGNHILVAGIQNLAVHPDFRNTELLQQIVNKAMQEAALRNAKFGLLFYYRHPAKVSFEKMGWIKMIAPITALDANSNTILLPNHKGMFLPLDTEAFPVGPMDLLGREW